MSRRCEKCKRPLAGKRGHGFVIHRGKAIVCGPCAYPEKRAVL